MQYHFVLLNPFITKYIIYFLEFHDTKGLNLSKAWLINKFQ